MSTDEKLQQQVEEYAKLAKENPKIDVGMLMVNALQNDKRNMVSGKAKKWAYLISVGVPPIGLLFALRYYMGDEDDGKDVAWICIILTILSIVIFWITFKMMFSGSGASLQQIEQIKPSDALQLGQ